MIRRLVGISCMLSLVFAGVAVSHAQDIYPQPVTEYAEQTGPGTMTFLSYPKYYQDKAGIFQEVNTNLEFSDDPDWDYEVIKGIWNLKVNANGLFQAEHEGDVFTYHSLVWAFAVMEPSMPLTGANRTGRKSRCRATRFTGITFSLTSISLCGIFTIS